MIDVVIVAYGSRAIIGRCIEAARQIPGLGRIVVVDHGDDGSGDVAAELGATVVRDLSNPGFGAGQNRGLKESDADYVLLLNPDAEIVSDAVARGAALLDARPDVALVQGMIENRGFDAPERSQGRELGPVHLWGRALGLRRLLGVPVVRAVARRSPALRDHAERVPTAPMEVETLAATAVLARHRALDDVEGFAAGDYFLYGEDLDLSRRLRQRGWKLVAVPDRWAVHISGASAASSWGRELEWWRGTMTFAARWWDGPAWSAALAAAVVRFVALALRRPGQAGAAWSAVIGTAWRVRRSPASARGRPSPTPRSPRRH